MKTIGLIGGMSWESTRTYYEELNLSARDRLGGLHSARLILWSFDFAEIEAHQRAGDWTSATLMMTDAARALEKAGAECILICSNTMHRMANEVQAAVNVPLIHIADATGNALQDAGVSKPLLLATRFTMEDGFYRDRLADQYGIEALVPDGPGRTTVHEIIYEELCRGMVSEESRARYLDVIDRARAEGADGVIFGCTEVGLLLSAEDTDLPTFDTTILHARAAMDFAL